MKNTLIRHARNLRGWTTARKLVVFAVDDYGNVRLASKNALAAMEAKGLRVQDRFDAFDTLETREDLERLCEALSSVKDAAGNPAVFTAYAIPANIDFDAVAGNGYTAFEYETLDQTFAKAAGLLPGAYSGAWPAWKEAMANGLLSPEFHGREHVNVQWFTNRLQQKDPQLLTALHNRSFACMPQAAPGTPGPYAAFEYTRAEELATHPFILQQGVALFEQVFGRRPLAFTPPNFSMHAVHCGPLQQAGIKTVDTQFLEKRYCPDGRGGSRFHYGGQPVGQSLTALVRNVVFEPADKRSVNWVEYALQQIETSFFWKKPAIISSHRVNFCGGINPANRQQGITSLRELLKRIVQKWPDAEFVSVADLQTEMGL